jgi:hypothetical protein
MEWKAAKMVNEVYAHFKRNKTPSVKDWELVAVSPTAAVFKNDKSKSYAFAYRGVATAGELLDAPAALLGNTFNQTMRYRHDKEFTRRHQPPRGYKRWAFGHSLGGAIVDQIMADGLADTGITFNPAIEVNKMHNRGVRRFYNRNDGLYKSIGQFSSNVTVINNDLFSQVASLITYLNPLITLYSHNLSQFVPDKERKSHDFKPDAIRRDPAHEPDAGGGTSGQSLVQSVILDKEHFTSFEAARQWAAHHRYKVDKHDETPTSWRFRQVSPAIFATNMYHAKTVPLEKVGNLLVAYKA